MSAYLAAVMVPLTTGAVVAVIERLIPARDYASKSTTAVGVDG